MILSIYEFILNGGWMGVHICIMILSIWVHYFGIEWGLPYCKCCHAKLLDAVHSHPIDGGIEIDTHFWDGNQQLAWMKKGLWRYDEICICNMSNYVYAKQQFVFQISHAPGPRTEPAVFPQQSSSWHDEVRRTMCQAPYDQFFEWMSCTS